MRSPVSGRHDRNFSICLGVIATLAATYAVGIHFVPGLNDVVRGAGTVLGILVATVSAVTLIGSNLK
jgi:hypothetical protein